MQQTLLQYLRTIDVIFISHDGHPCGKRNVFSNGTGIRLCAIFQSIDLNQRFQHAIWDFDLILRCGWVNQVSIIFDIKM